MNWHGVFKTSSKKQERYDRMYLDIATRVAEMSFATRRKVGAVIEKDGNILAYGFNGMPSGFDNDCETDDTTNAEVLHAEENAICKVAGSTQSSVGATIYVTASPCITCARLIKQAGIIRVVYSEEFRCTAGLEFLRKAGVKTEMIND